MKKFKLICSNIHDPYFNLASEEYLLKNTSDFYIYLWINSPAVIVGNNQNTLMEVNLNETEKKNVKVVRRLTGGGAVYHDLNNICYTIISPYNKEENNYVKYTKPVIEYLSSLGVKAEFSGRNDICVDGKKVSGNAEVVYKDRIMHHGTILFDTDLEVLSTVLNQNKIKIQSKGIKSIRARVVNIKSLLSEDMSCEEFVKGLYNHFKKSYTPYEFSEDDISKIQKLSNEKYSTYEWNIGFSPKGNNKIDLKFDFGIMNITFDLIDGLIQNAEIFGDFFSNEKIADFSKNLNGKKFTKEDLYSAFIGIELFIKGASAKNIVNKIFE